MAVQQQQSAAKVPARVLIHQLNVTGSSPFEFLQLLLVLLFAANKLVLLNGT